MAGWNAAEFVQDNLHLSSWADPNCIEVIDDLVQQSTDEPSNVHLKGQNLGFFWRQTMESRLTSHSQGMWEWRWRMQYKVRQKEALVRYQKKAGSFFASLSRWIPYLRSNPQLPGRSKTKACLAQPLVSCASLRRTKSLLRQSDYFSFHRMTTKYWTTMR